MKSLSPRVMLSSHLLPKGTKTKVNLEDQGRQKVSFSFSLTKKPLQSPLFTATSPDKSVTEPQAALSQSTSDKGGQSADSKTEQKQTPVVPTSIAETSSQTPVSSATKLKPDLAKMHFKKQILSSSVTEDQPTSVMPEEQLSSELQPLQTESKIASEFPIPQPQNVTGVGLSEFSHLEASETRETPSLKKPAASSGKDGETPSKTEQDKAYRRKTRSQSMNAPPGSESDGDSVQMSSSRKSGDSKSKSNSDSRSKEVKKSSSGSHMEEKERSSSKRSEHHERSSSYSKSDRDSRHTSSRTMRSDKDRRRSRSRSRSRSRGSRTSSSHSRSERSRGDRGLRSERSYYHDSDRRTHRSSPRRERRRSRSRTDRTRDSSDSEDDHRKTRTRTSDSSRSSGHSSSYKESKSSYSKSERASKSIDSPHSSEIDKRTQRTSKRLSDSDSQRKCSPDLDSSYRKLNTHHKSETNNKSSSSSMHTNSQIHEKCQKSSSSDSEADQKGKSTQGDKSSGSDEKSKDPQNKISRPDSKPMTPSRSSVKTTGHDRQSDDMFHSSSKALSCAATADVCSQSEKEKTDSHLDGNKHGNQDDKQIVSCTEKSLQEPSSTIAKETKSDLDENKSTSALTLSESLKHVNATLENLTNVKDSLSSNQPHVNSNAAVLNSCSCDESIVHSQDQAVIGCLQGPKSLPETEDAQVTQNIQQNTKPEIVELNKVEKESDTSVPLKFESQCFEPENQLTCGQQSMDNVRKSSGTTKKSRWDIVGQDTSESDNSQRTPTVDSKPTVKKIISVKKIEFSKDSSQQDSDVKHNIQPEAETHSTSVKQMEISKHDTGSDSTSMIDIYKDQSEPSRASTSIEHCDVERTLSQKTSTDELLHLSDASQVDAAAMVKSWNGNDHEETLKDSSHKNKLSKRASLHQDASGGQSEASDSDNSEYDSDCGEAIKRLHSVVVVPKNSSLTMDTKDTGSPCSPMNISELYNANITADMNTHEVSSQQRLGSPSAAYGETSAQCAGANNSSHSSMLCQSQSNMIDSTSHSEGSSTIGALPYMVDNISAHGSATDPAHSLENSRQCEQGLKQHSLSSSSRGERLYSSYQRGDFSNSDHIGDKTGLLMSWDFSQPEQPSSTYQQPDSSHGPQLANTKMTENSPKGQEHRQSNTIWNHESQNMQTSRKPYLHAHEHYQEAAGEIHPDSLTNDHDDYSGDKPANLSKTAVEWSGCNAAGSSSFVQGHEISSNSRSVVPDPPREDNFRPHRGRGPPKKRRPEIESDSDNEAEAGPAGKRERQGDFDISKETSVKAEVQRPSLTLQDFQDANKWKEMARSKKMPPYFDLIEENLYLTER